LIWFEIMIIVLNDTQNLLKFAHFESFIFIQQWIVQNIWYIGTTICIFNNKLQKVSLKNSYMWKNEKDYKRLAILLLSNPIGFQWLIFWLFYYLNKF
jgi:hypothetical protein